MSSASNPESELRILHDDVLRHAGRFAGPARHAGDDEEATETRAAHGTAPRRLPMPPNRTIGRDAELVNIAGRLRDRATRLLTLTGPGGVGKTRLAAEAARTVAADFAHGACFASLAPVRDAGQVDSAIVDALGVTVLAGESPAQAAERFLAPKQLLLVADNFEHVLGGAAVVAALLDACPSLTVLATSFGRTVAEDLAQSCDRDLDSFERAARGLIGPQLVDQTIGRDGLVGVQRQEGQQADLLASSDHHPAPVALDLDRPEDPKTHHARALV
jgi:hypothetical protein